jgi:hypothetical protein
MPASKDGILRGLILVYTPSEFETAARDLQARRRRQGCGEISVDLRWQGGAEQRPHMLLLDLLAKLRIHV